MYKKGPQGWIKHLDFIVLDILCLSIAFLLAYAVRMGSFAFWTDAAYRSLGIVILLGDFGVILVSNTFKNVLKRDYYREFTVTFKQACFLEAVVIVYLFTIQESVNYSRLMVYLLGVFYFLFGFIVRLAWKKHLKRVKGAAGRRSLLIVTVDRMAVEAAKNVTKNNYEQFRIAGLAILDCDKRKQTIANVPVIAYAGDIVECVCRGWIDEVLICMPHGVLCPKELTEKFMQMGVVVHTVLYQGLENKGQKQFIERISNYTVITNSINYATQTQQFIKRTMDIIGGLVGSLITCILFLVLAPVIYILSPGPIFFKQERVGKNGKRFYIYKFRSMYPDAEKRKKELMAKNRVGDSLMFKIEGDPRIIGSKIRADGTVKKGFGNFIRDFSLDEFPQFFNVLKGDMSLVGTRPPTVDEWERYELHHRARLAIRPGITGLWQVSGRSSITSFEEVVKLDTQYITEWSMGLDCKILIKTVGVVLGKRGAM